MWNLIVSVPDHCLSFYFKSVHCYEVTNQNIHNFFVTYISKTDFCCHVISENHYAILISENYV